MISKLKTEIAIIDPLCRRCWYEPSEETSKAGQRSEYWYTAYCYTHSIYSCLKTVEMKLACTWYLSRTSQPKNSC